MQKLIDAYEFEREMYRLCIHTDEEIEKGRAKWDSGLWIRYKVFEDAITLARRVDAVEVVRCKDCKYMTEHYDTDGSVPYWTCSEWDSGTDYDGYCYWGERKKDEE